MSVGPVPAAIGAPGLLVAVSIGTTLLDPLSATYAVVPSGVIAMLSGLAPAVMGVPAVLVAMSMGVTLFEPKLVGTRSCRRG